MYDTGIVGAEILLPKDTDMSAWATVACDQFTSEREYWDKLDKFVGQKKSTLRLVLPEIYLDGTEDERITRINANIKQYLKEGVFNKPLNGFVLTVRETPFVKKRIGLVGAIDLERYEYAAKSDALIRSTEGTIEERIPPRLKIRSNAELEFPHVMVLFDDEKKEITERLYAERKGYKKLYDFELNMGGGRIEGYYVDDSERVIEKFSSLLNEQRLISKYGKADKFLFAVGDGNHSLATAKTHWNNIKSTLSDDEIKDHPARFALCEFVNVYDDGIYFEPIYRFVSGVDVDCFIKGLKESVNRKIGIYANKKEEIYGKIKDIPEAITSVDRFVKNYIDTYGGKVDYIHGDENLRALVNESDDSVGILFDKIDKSDLFKYVSEKGALPRKTFSMGNGVEKRYYLEGRKITK